MCEFAFISCGIDLTSVCAEHARRAARSMVDAIENDPLEIYTRETLVRRYTCVYVYSVYSSLLIGCAKSSLVQADITTWTDDRFITNDREKNGIHSQPWTISDSWVSLDII